MALAAARRRVSARTLQGSGMRTLVVTFNPERPPNGWPKCHRSAPSDRNATFGGPPFSNESLGQIQVAGGFTYTPWSKQFRPTPRFACLSVPQLGTSERCLDLLEANG